MCQWGCLLRFSRSEMLWLALEKFAATEFTDKYSIARRDVLANGNDVRLSLNFIPSNEL